MMNIAIDGPAGAGKSTIARAAARKLGYVYVDTGAIYRCVALYLKRCGIDSSAAEAVEKVLGEIHPALTYDESGTQHTWLNGEDVSGLIRTPEISAGASACSAIPAVRAYLLEMQRKMAREQNVVMDGRDIGTVVLPDAQVKIFLTASPEERASRRCRELRGKGVECDYAAVLEEIRVRDARDSGRATAPLKQAPDAELLDTTELDPDQALDALLRIVARRMG